MFQFPHSWIQHFGVELVTATSPELGARFRYYERLRPQRSASQVVGDLLRSDPSFAVHELGPMRRLVTLEGEYGASVEILGRRRERPVTRLVYLTFMDDFSTLLDVLADIPASLGEVKARADRLFASQRFDRGGRPRMFYFRPLRGWQAIPSGAAVNYYPPGFPRDQTTISVPHAVVPEEGIEAGRERLASSLGAGLEVHQVARSSLRSDLDTEGLRVVVQGDRASLRLHRELAVFADELRLYWMRLETARTSEIAELSEAFAAMAATIRPLPSASELRSGLAFPEPVTSFDHWAN